MDFRPRKNWLTGVSDPQGDLPVLLLTHQGIRPRDIDLPAGLGFSSLVFYANRFVFDKKRANRSFLLFKRGNHSFCKEWKSEERKSKFPTPAKPKSVIWILSPVFSFLLKKEQSTLFKRANNFFVKNELLLFLKK